jgi:ABC-type lipoprotein release transport system permease subunit
MLQGDDPATQIAVNQRDLGLKQLPATLARQAIERADVEIVPWTVSLKQLKEQMDLDKAFGIYLYGFLGLIAGVGIMNAILMGVMERMREFGIMIAVGMRPRDLATLVLAEGAVVGVAGTLAGVALGLLASWPLMVYGIDYGEMMAQGGPVSDVPIDTVMRAAIVPWTFVKYGLAAVAMAVVASIWPAWKATRLEPVETMRQL